MNNIDKLQKSINQLEEIVSNLVEERNALQAENKKLKEQQLTEDEIIDVLDTFPMLGEMGDTRVLAKAIIKARGAKERRW